MPVGTRVSTSIPRSYLYDARFNSIVDPLAREGYLRAKLQADNLGRLPGDADTLRGLLFPLGPPSLEEMDSIVKAWVRGGLVLRYKVGRCWFIEIADNGSTMRLVGRMTDRSEFPEPPNSVVKKWEKRFGMKRVQLRNPNVGTNQVHTESEPGTMPVSPKGSEGKGEEKRSEERGGEGSLRETTDLPVANAPGAADAALSQEERLLTADLLNRITNKEFDPIIGLNGYKHRDEFFHQVLAVGRNRRFDTDKDRERAMKAVTNRCNDAGFKTPKGWMKVMYALRDNMLS